MFRTTRWVVGVAAVGLLAAAAPADDSKLKVKVGDPFPDFTEKATQADLIKKGATTVSLADLKGKVAVVAFYPKALTGG